MKQRASAAAKEIEKCNAKRKRQEETLEARQQRLRSYMMPAVSKRLMRMREEATCLRLLSLREADEDYHG